ncbi:AAA family ATPase [Brevundimonas sp. LM2]|uniref:AAA family ATPase n=1 Tax=Brevundimonas sp. LM2 TaxID=1938605 RepID=UPI00209B9E45|nr:AAA family ATPase [Brevundimonas sp. LM2]
MREGAGIPSQTIEQWLSRTESALAEGGARAAEHKAAWAGRTVLVDESSMQSNAQADRLMKASEALGLARMIYIGDERQLGSPEAGAPCRLALGSGLQHAQMTEIIRQRDPVLLAAVTHMARGDITNAIRGLGDRVVAVGANATDIDLAKAAVVAWSDYRTTRGTAPAVIVPTNALRAEVGQMIRSDLIASGELGQVREVPTLRQIRMTSAEAAKAACYTEGQVLVFHTGNKAAGIGRGSELTVVGRDENRNTLVLDDGKGTKRVLDLNAKRRGGRQAHDAYRESKLEVRDGDRMVWDKLDKTLGVRVGESFTVEKMDKAGWTIRTEDGQTRTVPASGPMLRFVSYGYAETADRSQASTYKDVVGVLSSKHGEAATESRAYVMMSRSAENLTFITNDPKLLVIKLSKQTGLNAIASHELAGMVSDISGKNGLAALVDDSLGGSKTEKPGAESVLQSAGAYPEKADDKAFEKAHQPASPTQVHSL